VPLAHADILLLYFFQGCFLAIGRLKSSEITTLALSTTVTVKSVDVFLRNIFGVLLRRG